jgi:4-amino-4-deoxy-L-arabinose transferase-like glycosyltransferase
MALLDRASGFAHRRPNLALVLLCLALFLPGWFTIPATDRDEARFAQASRQMLDSGDYVHIRVGDEERNKKPVGIHWAQVAGVHLLEVTGLATRRDIWAYRLPSLLGAILAVLLTFRLGRGLIGRRPALLAGAMLAACMVLVGEAHIAKTDAALLASITAAMGLMGAAYLRPSAFTARQALVFWLTLGLGILLKGPIAPMVPLLTGVTLAIMDRRQGGSWLHAPWFAALRPGWGVPLMLAVTLPWFVAIGLATEGRFFAQALGDDMLGKVGQADEKHWGPPGYYLGSFAIAAFPSAWIAILALPHVWEQRRRPELRFLLAWIVPTWLVFEAVATKLPHYVLPTYPAIMLLAAMWAMDPLRREPPRWLRLTVQFGFAAVALGFALVALIVPWAVTGHEPFVALIAPLAAALLVWLVWHAAAARHWARAAALGAVAVVPLYATVLEGIAPRIEALWIAPRLAAALPPDTRAENFGITGHAEPSVLFHIGGETRLLRRGEDAARFLAENPARVVAVGERALADFRREAEALGIRPTPVGEVAGFNYTRGRRVTLTVFRRGE